MDNTKMQELIEELELCFSDWQGDFIIEVQEDDAEEDYSYFSVAVKHKLLGKDYHFTARVDDDLDCQMDFYDDSWHWIDKANIFAWMWFETADRRERLAVVE